MGKKISNFLKGEIVSSVFYLAFGLCLILIPDQTVNIICKIVFGLVMIAAGVYHIAIYAAEKEKATILDLFTGVIVTVLGIFLFFTPQIVIRILPYLLGAFVLVHSIWKIKGSYRLKKAERTLEDSFYRMSDFHRAGNFHAVLFFYVSDKDDFILRNYSDSRWSGGYRISCYASTGNEKN